MTQEVTSSNREQSTRVILGDEKEVTRMLNEAGVRAASDGSLPCFNIVMDRYGPPLAISSIDPIRKLQERYPNYVVRYLLDVQQDNLEYAKQLAESKAVEVRHLEGVKANFCVTSKDYFSYVKSLKEGLPKEIVWSSDPNMIAQMLNVYERLWESGIPADVRIKQLRNQIEIGETRILTDPDEISKETVHLMESSSSEVLILTISEDPILRYGDAMKSFARKVGASVLNGESNMRVRLLIPLSDPKNKSQLDDALLGVEYRTIDYSGISFSVYDRTKAVIIQYTQENDKKFGKSMVSAILTTNKETVLGLTSIFESLWRENELRDLHERTAREARLLQDILSHDIRNYNQVLRLSAELLKEEIKEEVALQSILESMLRAVDGSTNLLERTKKLGKILSEEKPKLYPVDLKKTIRESLLLIKASNRDKVIEYSESYPSSSSLQVEADDILGEVFVNLFSNSARYSKGKDVRIEVVVVDGDKLPSGFNAPPRAEGYWKISISDYGIGIPDQIKNRIFERYLSSAKGSGLGMSIVHALVVERYKGSVKLKDRVPGDYHQGTVVEILLPAA
ncbi:MAG: sensor histidine kinase [Nitrososphaerales archaeon]